MNNIARLQDQLWNIGAFKGIKNRKGKELTYEQAVDGINGKMTKQAIKNAEQLGYDLNSNGVMNTVKSNNNSSNKQSGLASMREITHAARTGGMSQTVETQKSKDRSVEQIYDFLSHNPAKMALEDLDRAVSNRITEKLFNVRPFKGRKITSLPTMQTEELKKQIQFAKNKGKNVFDSEMYKQMYGHNYASRNGENNQDRSGFWNRMNSPKGRLEHTLGAYSFYTDKNGNTIVRDVYDFNVGQKQGGDGGYATVRNFLGEFGSKSTDPNNGKIIYEINLGKL